MRRREIVAFIARNQRERRAATQAIEESGAVATSTNILRYRLWTEQDQKWCPYCSDTINLQAALDGHQTNIDHILPCTPPPTAERVILWPPPATAERVIPPRPRRRATP